MRKHRYLLWAALVVALIIHLPGVISRRAKGAAREVVSPFQSMISTVAARVSDGISAITGPRRSVAESEALRTKVATLQLKVSELEFAERSNSELLSALNFVEGSAHQLVPCKVIARGDVSGWWETVRLNKGTAAGVTTDLAVITPSGLVGKTISVSRHTCDVLLITDRNCRIAARCERTGIFGIVVGNGASASGSGVISMQYPGDPCRMDYVASTADIRSKDRVVTSGLGGVYPGGLTVGVVESTEQHESGLNQYQSATVLPAADLARLKYVFVVRQEPSSGDTQTPDNGASR